MKKSKFPVLYDTKAYGTNSLCSGFKVYPNGKQCSGCSDCTNKKGYRFFGVKNDTIEKAFNRSHTIMTISK